MTLNQDHVTDGGKNCQWRLKKNDFSVGDWENGEEITIETEKIVTHDL